MKSNFTHFTITKRTLFAKMCLLVVLVFCAQYAKTQVLLSESFDGTTFPPTGWTATITNSVSSPFASSLNWQRMASNAGAVPNIASHSGAAMADYNSFWINTGGTAELSTSAIDFSQSGGINRVSFWMYRYYGNDQLEVYVNTTASSAGGTLLGTITNNYSSSPVAPATGWYSYSYDIPAGFNTATNYIIFKAISYYGDDINIDDVNVTHIPPCSGMPSGTITTATPCPGRSFQIAYTDTVASGMSYLWQTSPNGFTWTNAGVTTPAITTSINVPTYFRVIATCAASNLSDTSTTLIQTAPFNVCYCVDSGANNYYAANIGNVLIQNASGSQTVLNNGNPSPILNNPNAVYNYTSYFNLTPPLLYLDSVYQFSVTQICNSTYFPSSPVNIYLDLNGDGVYEPSELIFDHTTSSSSSPVVTDTFRIPVNAFIGATGMRVLLQPYSTSPLDPCSTFYDGEIEDYIVNISHDPCSGPANAGTATTSDSSLCPGLGYTFLLSDVNHETQLGNIQWDWQQSPDNGYTWGPVTNTVNRDTITLEYYLPVQYRMRMICMGSHDTTYSNVLSIKSSEPYACYCYSTAIGGRGYDSTDIGAFGIGSYLFQKPSSVNNSHLSNPQAVKGHTDYTHNIIHLVEDSTYHVAVYQILRSETHGNAKVTMFIDYNNSLTYDIPDERVWTAYTTADSFFLTTDLTIPSASVVPNVLSGMRVIINDNVSPNVPSDDACGAYTSGETQDYVVMIHDASTVGVGTIKNLHDLAMFPNPTTGQFKLQFKATEPVKHLSVRVSNMTGQQIIANEYLNTSGEFATMLDLSQQPKGVYFVEILADGERSIRKLVVE